MWINIRTDRRFYREAKAHLIMMNWIEWDKLLELFVFFTSFMTEIVQFQPRIFAQPCVIVGLNALPAFCFLLGFTYSFSWWRQWSKICANFQRNQIHNTLNLPCILCKETKQRHFLAPHIADGTTQQFIIHPVSRGMRKTNEIINWLTRYSTRQERRRKNIWGNDVVGDRSSCVSKKLFYHQK